MIMNFAVLYFISIMQNDTVLSTKFNKNLEIRSEKERTIMKSVLWVHFLFPYLKSSNQPKDNIRRWPKGIYILMSSDPSSHEWNQTAFTTKTEVQ